MNQADPSALLQRRTRQQSLCPGEDASKPHDSEFVQSFRHGYCGWSDWQPRLFRILRHWIRDGFKICWLNAICSSVYLHRWQFFCQHATSFSKRVSPTVLTQHPVVLNFLFPNLYLGLLCPSNITIALFPLRYPMQLETAISGGISIGICIWSEHPLRFYYFHSFPLA